MKNYLHFFTNDETAKEIVGQFAGFSPLHADELMHRLTTSDLVTASRQFHERSSVNRTANLFRIEGKHITLQRS